MSFVMDSSALLALLRLEPGADIVDNLIADRANTCFVHAVNLCEVYYNLARELDEPMAEEGIQTLEKAGVKIREDMDPEFWRQAGRYKADLRRVSMADCFCLALAVRESAPIVTADHHEFDTVHSQGLAKFIFIR